MRHRLEKPAVGIRLATGGGVARRLESVDSASIPVAARRAAASQFSDAGGVETRPLAYLNSPDTTIRSFVEGRQHEGYRRRTTYTVAC